MSKKSEYLAICKAHADAFEDWMRAYKAQFGQSVSIWDKHSREFNAETRVKWEYLKEINQKRASALERIGIL